MSKGFTLIELLVVIAIIGILSSIGIIQYSKVIEKSRYARAQSELSTIANGLKLYANDHNGDYPEDISRNLPPEMENYISIQDAWPKASWPESVFDWDNWTDPNTGESIYQISIRFCPINPVGSTDFCKFPNENWATDFDYYSSAYWCIMGPCRAHISQPIDHPAYCINCTH